MRVVSGTTDVLLQQGSPLRFENTALIILQVGLIAYYAVFVTYINIITINIHPRNKYKCHISKLNKNEYYKSEQRNCFIYLITTLKPNIYPKENHVLLLNFLNET